MPIDAGFPGYRVRTRFIEEAADGRCQRFDYLVVTHTIWTT
jgi:hypothetical protein